MKKLTLEDLKRGTFEYLDRKGLGLGLEIEMKKFNPCVIKEVSDIIYNWSKNYDMQIEYYDCFVMYDMQLDHYVGADLGTINTYSANGLIKYWIKVIEDKYNFEEMVEWQMQVKILKSALENI